MTEPKDIKKHIEKVVQGVSVTYNEPAKSDGITHFDFKFDGQDIIIEYWPKLEGKRFGLCYIPENNLPFCRADKMFDDLPELLYFLLNVVHTVDSIILISCPFCGKDEAELIENLPMHEDFFVQCNSCFARTGRYRTAREAKETWIQRTE